MIDPDTDDIAEAVARETTASRHAEDIVARVKAELREERKRPHGFLEQLRANWALLGSAAAIGLGVWQSYDGLRQEVAKATSSLTELKATVERLSVSERTGHDRVLQLELRYEAMRDRVKSLEDWAQRASATPAGRRLEAPSPAPKE